LIYFYFCTLSSLVTCAGVTDSCKYSRSEQLLKRRHSPGLRDFRMHGWSYALRAWC